MATGAPIQSCAVAVVASLDHAGDPYPLMGASLTPMQAAIWLARSTMTEQLRACPRAVDPTMFRAWPVAPQVNSPKFDEPSCSTPIDTPRLALDILHPRSARTSPGNQAER